MAGAWSIVARREYTEGVRSRWFVISTVLGPLLMGGLVALSVALELRGSGKPVRVALVDEATPDLGALVQTTLQEAPPGEPARFMVEPVVGEAAAMSALDARVASGEVDGYLVLPADIIVSGHASYVGTDASSTVDMARLSSRVEKAVIRARAQALGLKPDATRSLLAHVDLDTRQANGEGASGSAAFGMAYGAAILLYMTILLYGITVMRSVIQEKTSRVLEVIVACASPWNLMVGKLIGVGAVGLTQMGCWLGAAGLLAAFRGPILARFGVPGAEHIALPSVGAGPVAIVVLYFLAGYALYSALYAAVGAINNSERDAQQAQMPITFLLVGAFLCFPVITAAPRDPAAVALSLVPFFSPVLMPMRTFLTPVPLWQLATSIALLAGSIVAVTWAAARIYRVGILMYGKKPTLGELLRWIRAG
jgi:ABC-2 type transport system permease protein